MVNTLTLQSNGAIATLTLNRPEVRNAFNAEMIGELRAAAEELAGRDEVQAVVLRGAGKSFSAGADVNWMRSSLELTEAENLDDALRMSDMFAALRDLPQPLVAQVHGAALGGGMGLLAVADIVVAAKDTVFGFTETKLGILPAVISRFVAPKIGASWARALFTTGQRFDVEIARAIGLVHWTADLEQLDRVVAEVLDELRSAGSGATRAAKRLALEITGLSDGEARTMTARAIATQRISAEGQEGLRAFIDKRPPAWRE